MFLRFQPIPSVSGKGIFPSGGDMDISSISGLSYSGASPDTQAQPAGPEQRALIRAIRTVNSAQLFGQDKELTFVKDRETQKPVIRIISKETGDVVAQIPAENVLLMAEEVNGG